MMLTRRSAGVSGAGLYLTAQKQWIDEGGVHLVVDRRERQAGELAASRRRREQAHGDQHGGADHEHQDRVVQEVHVEQPAHGGAPGNARSCRTLPARTAACRARIRSAAQLIDPAPFSRVHRMPRMKHAAIGGLM